MMEGTSLRITAVIPAFNEERTISDVVKGTLRYVSDVLVVDDGSQDNTASIASSAGATVLRHNMNSGYGKAISTGFGYVKGNGTDIAIILDGDGQHDPHEIPKLISPIIEGRADIVLGSRFMACESRPEIPRYRRFGIGLVNRAWRVVTPDRFSDTQCGFRAYSRKAIESIEIAERGMSASLEILDEARKNELTIVEVPISVSYQGDTSTFRPEKHGMELVNYVLRKLKEEHPLLIFGGLGLAVTFVGVVLGVISLNVYLEDAYLPYGPSIAAAVCLYLGTLMIFGGLILNAIQSLASRLEGGEGS